MVKNKKKDYKKTYYYYDEINDDFARFQFKPINIDESFNYKHSKFYWFWAKLARLIVVPILAIIAKCVYLSKIKNKKVLKQLKNKGYFLYSNHTSAFDPINHACIIQPFKYTAIIASIDAFSLKGLKNLIHFLGAIPVPLNLKMYKKFFEDLKYHISKKHKIVIYPEAHIWPFYDDVRNFKSVSFRYPCELNTPILVATTIYKKRKISKRPKSEIYLSGPIYPNKELPFKEQINDLRDRTYQVIKDTINSHKSYKYYDYIKLN